MKQTALSVLLAVLITGTVYAEERITGTQSIVATGLLNAAQFVIEPVAPEMSTQLRNIVWVKHNLTPAQQEDLVKLYNDKTNSKEKQ